MAKKIMELPVYYSKHHKYVRECDFPEGFIRLELKQFMKDRLQPLIQGEEGTINDAIFWDDYRGFLDYLIGKEVKLDSLS